jgi:hypothetical protein
MGTAMSTGTSSGMCTVMSTLIRTATRTVMSTGQVLYKRPPPSTPRPAHHLKGEGPGARLDST